MNLILLVQIGKSNPQAFKLWEYIGKIFADKTLVNRLLEKPDYEQMIALITGALKARVKGDDNI